MKTNKVQKVLLGSTTLLAMGVAGHAVQAATTGVPIQAIILDPVDITQNQALNFGSLTEAGAGTATIDNTGAISTSATITSVGGTIQQGLFTLKGSTGRQIDVTAPASVNISDGGGNLMAVGSFTINGAAGTINATAFTTSLGAATVTGFDLGGTLSISGGQAAGTYNGSVTLTANYN